MQELFFSTRRGAPLNVTKTIARHPGLIKQWSALGRFLASGGLLPARERELVILRMGWRAKSIYEFGQHTIFALQAGLSDAEIRSVTQSPESGPWTADERTLFAMVDELVDDDCVTDETWERLSRRWGPAELVELVLLAGFYRMVSDVLNSLGVQREDGVPGWPESVAARRAAGTQQARDEDR